MSKRYRKKNKILKVFSILTAFVFVVGATIAITLALMNTKTDVTHNTFVGNEGLSLEVAEPGWTGGGKDMAENYTPGLEIPKDPILINTTKSNTDDSNSDVYKNNSEYVAIKLEYQILKANVKNIAANLENDDSWQTVPYNVFNQLADIQYNGSSVFNTTKWEAKNVENTVFYYKEIVPPDITDLPGHDTDTNHKTEELFDHIVIKSDLKADTIFNCPITGQVDGTDHFKGEFNSTPYTKWTELKKALENEGGYTITSSLKETYSYTKDAHTTYVHVGLIPFRINVQGYAVQAYENHSDISGTYKAKLDNLIEHGDPDYTP